MTPNCVARHLLAAVVLWIATTPGHAQMEDPGTMFRDCDECPQMIVVPAGKFTMGLPRLAGPPHQVTIREPFAVGVYEVTRAEYGHFAMQTGYSGASGCRTYENGVWKERSDRGWRDPGFAQTEQHPVVCIGWHDAQAYVQWLSAQTGEQYRLLSESEWEYAARGGSSTLWYWGDEVTEQCRYANGADLALRAHDPNWGGTTVGCDDRYPTTAPVGSFEPNGYGLFDVAGNAWEWVEDCWYPNYFLKGYFFVEIEGSDEIDGRVVDAPFCGDLRGLRGGAWDIQELYLLAAARSKNTPDNRNSYDGFRVARTR